MTIHLVPAAAVIAVHALRLGPLRFSVYGLCAAFGLMLAMATARGAAHGPHAELQLPDPPLLAPDAVWDAGLFALLSCFFASRLLLVLRDPIAFIHYPLLVLSLPSLTFGGMAAAAVITWVYLRRKHLSVLSIVDIYAPSAALLAAFLELGHALDGTEVGMPSTLPWAVHEPGISGSLRFHPVALYGCGAALLLASALWYRLRSHHGRHGEAAALALMGGGAAAFGLAMVTLPSPAPVDLWLEPGQWVAVAAMLGGALLFTNGLREPSDPARPLLNPFSEATYRHTEVH